MFFVTFILFFVYFWLYNIKYWIFKSFFMGLYSMIMEAFSPYGTDNLTVPLGDLIMVSFLI